MSPHLNSSFSHQSIHVLFIGTPYIDVLLYVPQFPEEDSKSRAIRRITRLGGNAITTSRILGQLDTFRCYLMASLPEKRACEALLDALTESAVCTQLCVFKEGVNDVPMSYAWCNEATGSRTIVSDNRVPELSVEEMLAGFGQLGWLERRAEATSGREMEAGGYHWVHFEGRNEANAVPVISQLASYRDGKRPIILSVELEKPTRSALNEAARVADIVFYSQEWARSHAEVGKKEVEEDGPHGFFRSRRRHVQNEAILFCTWGKKGAYAYDVRRDRIHFAAPPTVHQVQDTVGAGDSFIAGVIQAMSTWLKIKRNDVGASGVGSQQDVTTWEGLDLEGVLRYGCALAAAKCAVGEVEKVFDMVKLDPASLCQDAM